MFNKKTHRENCYKRGGLKKIAMKKMSCLATTLIIQI